MGRVNFHLNLKMKLILVYISILIVPIFVLGYYLTNHLSNTILANTKDNYSHSAAILNQNLLNRLSSFADIAHNIAYDNRLLEYLNVQSEDDYSVYRYYVDFIDPMLKRASSKESNVLFKIYTDNANLKFSGHIVSDPATMRSKLEQAGRVQGKVVWNGPVRNGGKTYLSCLAPIYDYMYSNRTVGVLELLIDGGELGALFGTSDTRDSLVFLKDDRENLLASGFAISDEAGFFADRAGWRADSKVTFRNADYLYISTEVESTRLNISGWVIGYLIPLDDLQAGTRQTWITSILLSLLCIAVSLLFLYLLSRSITSRVDALIAKMRLVRKGHLRTAVQVTGRDEIAQLGEHFNTMVQELDMRIREIVEFKLQIKDAEIQKQHLMNANHEAQLLALQSQINPHYLFNTLESIRMHLLIKGDRETSGIVQLFAESFRHMHEETDEMVSIGHELKFIRLYFSIQQFRYPGKLKLDIHMDSGLEDCLIPKLIIQPLIENAIYHGLEMIEETGTVSLTIVVEDGGLHIRVADDGLGMSPEQLKALLASVHDDAVRGKHLAMRNIRKRLGLQYGERAKLRIDSKENEGTVIDIYLPAGG